MIREAQALLKDIGEQSLCACRNTAEAFRSENLPRHNKDADGLVWTGMKPSEKKSMQKLIAKAALTLLKDEAVINLKSKADDAEKALHPSNALGVRLERE